MPAQQQALSLVAIFMDTKKIYFSPFIVVVILIMTLVCIGSPILLIPLFIHAVKTDNIGAIIFLLILYSIGLIMLPFFIMTLKNFIAFIKKNPAIELTPNYYIDNIENIKLEWNNISDIWILQYRDSFLKISVIDNTAVYNQTKGRIWKFIFRRQVRNNGILSVNLAFLKGKSLDIVNLVKDYQKKVLQNKA